MKKPRTHRLFSKFCTNEFLCAFICFSLCACHIGKQTLDELNLYEFKYRNASPSSVFLYDASSVADHVPAVWVLESYSFTNMAELAYVPAPGDTLRVRILEFASEMSALAFYLNSGLVQETLPVVEGNFRELAMRSGARLFVFRYGLLRGRDRRELEGYVQNFPDYRAGLPQEFLSLPLSDRVIGETSIQMRDFFGVPSSFPVLVQGYDGDGVRWNAARSLNYVSSDDWRKWGEGIRRSGRRVRTSADTVFFDAGAEERGLAIRQNGGRIVCVWGSLSPKALRKRFDRVSRSVYDSPE